MKVMFGYQDTFYVVANGLQELVGIATETQNGIHKKEINKDYKAMYSIQ